jgi:hypothetical protein
MSVRDIVMSAAGVPTIPQIAWTYRGGLASAVSSATMRTINKVSSTYYAAGDSGKIATSTDLTTWTNQDNLSQSATASTLWQNSINCGIWTGSVYMIGGQGGRIATSSNGVTWTRSTTLSSAGWGTAENNQVQKLATNGTLIVAVGTGGRTAASSNGGASWTYSTGLSTPFAGQNVFSLVWDPTANRFLAGSGAGHLAHSTNGTTWTAITTLRSTAWGTFSTVNNLILNGSTIVAVGSNSRVAVSTDSGATWANQTGPSAIAGTAINFRGVFISGTYIICGGFAGIAFTSSNGTSWASQSTAFANSGWGTARAVNDMVVNGSTVVVVGGSGGIATTTNGVSWTYRSSLSSTVYGAQNNTGFITRNSSSQLLVGMIGTYPKLATSTDNAVTWTYQDDLAKIYTIWGRFSQVLCSTVVGSSIVIGGSGARIATSGNNGVTWTVRPSLMQTVWNEAGSVLSLAQGNGILVAGGSSGRIATSTDGGITWTYRAGLASTSWSTSNVNSICWNGSQFLAVGSNSAVATSTDGINWTYNTGILTLHGSQTYQTVIWTGSFYIAGATRLIATSTNGTTWQDRNITSSGWTSGHPIYSFTKTPAKIIAAGFGGNVASSSDAVTWLKESAVNSTSWGTRSGWSGYYDTSTNTLAIVGDSGGLVTSVTT